MSEPMMEKESQSTRRVFINNIDSYSSKYIAMFLCERVVGAAVDPDDGEVETEEEERMESGALQLVGSVSDQSVQDRPHVLEEYFNLDREELLPKLMNCDVIIYNISQHSEQVEEALWVVSALHKEMAIFSGPKMFILISTVMTWARSKLVNPTSWLGQKHEIPVFGDGNNILPTIHIKDLASVIKKVIEHQPKPYYLLAVDYSNNTMEEIVKTVASVLGPAKIKKKPIEEAFLIQDLSITEIDSMLVNLCMESVYLKELLSINWLCESGLVDQIELVVEEYRQTRKLLPIRLCVLGPPAVGKSTVSKLICERYKLHHITLEETISETITELENTVKNSDVDAENEDSAAEAQELLHTLKDNMEQNGGLLDDELLVKVLKDKLMSNQCRNQGFVLDGLPKTYEQAKELFSADEHESEDGTSQMSSYNRKMLPEFVLCLDASDAFLKDRVMNLPERLVQEHSYKQEQFLQQLARYRENSLEGETVVNYLDELDVAPLYLEVTSSDEPDHLLLMQRICDTVGKPRNYGPNSQEVEEEQRKRAEEKMIRESQERAQEEQREVEEARQRATCWEEWGLEEVRQQEEELLQAQSVPIRNYLLEHVMPTLTQGLIECCTAQPPDPVDFLAEFLFKNSPSDY
nr:PREDICTED: adenylate kinase 7-like [Paralichthys olivaceus]